MPTVVTTAVTEPGIYTLTDAEYHGDPVPGGSLSASGARLLLPPSCPARFAHARQHPPTPSRAFDLGHAAHREILGEGAELAVIAADSYRTKKAQDARDTAHAAGQTPVLEHEHAAVLAMVDALRAHPIAGELLHEERMLAEQSLFWVDQLTGVWRRARVDALSTPDPGAPPIVVDYKTCRSADPGHVSRALWDYGYALQAAWYLDAVTELLIVPRPQTRFLFVFQEITPPHLVTVVEPDSTALDIGTRLGRQALEIYRDCTAAGIWPSYTAPDEIPLVSLPAWAERQHQAIDEEWM